MKQDSSLVLTHKARNFYAYFSIPIGCTSLPSLSAVHKRVPTIKRKSIAEIGSVMLLFVISTALEEAL